MLFRSLFINPKTIDSLITITDKHSETEIKYLGLLTDLNKIDSYHVLTNFKILGIDQMLSPKGKSELTFINQKNNQIMIYDLTMSSDLPKCIQKNILYFDIENTKIGISISGGLPTRIMHSKTWLQLKNPLSIRCKNFDFLHLNQLCVSQEILS